jgi:serine/threonine protein kinase/tetratricopeptide (TPR) repeat protein
MTIASGTQFGPYKILDKIGAGGMGEVYRALDTRLEREVAIKFVSDSYLGAGVSSGTPVAGSPGSGTPQGTPHSAAHLSHERFLREARSAATLNHANICAIYDTGEQDGRPYLVMELLQGVTLKELLKSGALQPGEVIAFSTQAASALAAAHAKGIIHRDIKPANLFVVESGRGRKQIKILDFGLAKKQIGESSPDSRTFDGGADLTSATEAMTAMDLTSPGSTIGTVAYMSPEQARGAALDGRTDLFSLGSVMYEMATGKSPFSGGVGATSTADVFAALLMKDPPLVTSVNPAMPKELDPVVSHLLAKDKDQRTPSAEDLLIELEAIPVSSGGSSGKVPAQTSGSSTTQAAASSAQYSAQSGVTAKAPLLTPVDPADAARSRRRRNVIIIFAAIAAVAAAIPVVRHNMTTPAGTATTASATGTDGVPAAAANADANKDSVIIADFVNQTGDPVFDTTLNQALSAQLAQSPVLNIISQQHLRQSLGFLGKKQDDAITPAIAREIGEREGIKAILTGTIANLGNKYLITLAAQNTATGDQIATVEAQAAGKEQVLDTLDKAASQMRAKLGEDLASIKKLNAPFGMATTPSLEAFRAYALGDLAHQKGNDIPEAEGHYRRALELDPKLAMAWARLGVLYLNSGQLGSAMQYFTKAHELTGNVSEREKLYIDGHYYTEVLGDLNKGAETLEVATQEYPLQIDNFINLSAIYLNLGQLDKGSDEALKALALQPDDAVALGNVFTNYTQIDQLDEARKYLAQIHKLGLTGTSIQLYQLNLAAISGDTATMQKILADTAGRPDQFVVTGGLSSIQWSEGQFKLAATTIRQAAEQAAQSKAPDAQAGFVLGEAVLGWVVDACHDIEGAEKQALKLDKSKPTQASVATALAACGDAKRGDAALKDLAKKYPDDTIIQRVTVPQGLGWLAFKAGQPQKALDLMQRSQGYDSVSPGGYMRGMAYLELRDAPNAIAAFKSATKYQGLSFTSGNPYALATLGLGRAYVIAGDKANAKKSYERFFQLWKNADSDLPILATAKKEYAAL